MVEDLVSETEAAGGDPEQESPPLPAAAERDVHDAMVEGIQHLVRLLRYEQCAWSRLKKAVRAFMAIKPINREQKDTSSRTATKKMEIASQREAIFF